MLTILSMISFHSHLTLLLLLLLGLLVGSLAGIGEMNNNDGYFALMDDCHVLVDFTPLTSPWEPIS
jgi:hypothetical protein